MKIVSLEEGASGVKNTNYFQTESIPYKTIYLQERLMMRMLGYKMDVPRLLGSLANS